MDLGQIFTGDITADFMVSLFTLKNDAKVLDPCFGDGAFLRALEKRQQYRIYGYEIDQKLYEDTHKNFNNCVLRNKDFLKVSSKVKYDGIIMNPPYIRHEKIDDLSCFGINKEELMQDPLFHALPSTANLYMYFIIKAVSLLKRNGEMIVIFPGSWLNAQNGNRFQTALYASCGLERQIHITGNVFRKNPLVDVVILKLIKGRKGRPVAPEYIKLSDGVLTNINREYAVTDTGFQKNFSSVCTARRGLTTGCNKFFINPQLSGNISCTRPIISTPKQITGYSTKGAAIDRLLVIDQNNKNEKTVCEYLMKWEKNILREGRSKTLISKIKDHKEWYHLPLFDCRGIIFSYIIRSDMKFILNDSDYIIRDNFYICQPLIDKWLCFALLNNYYTYYQLECMGKKYGAGLLKIQRYDIEKLMFPDTDEFSDDNREYLRKLARRLAETGDRRIIKEITLVISGYASIPYDRIEYIYETTVANRLEEK